MRRLVVVIAVALLAGRANADMATLQKFLHSVEEASQVAAPVRGDGDFDVVGASATRHARVAMVVRPPADTYLELRPDGLKALLFGSGQPAQWLQNGGSQPAVFPQYATLAGSDFTAEDLEPFRAVNYKEARITDDAGGELTVSLFPATSQYSLVVMTFDREKKVAVKALYYRDTLSNLVKMRVDDGFVQVGHTWLPTSISMETFKLRTRSTFTLRWSANPTIPADLFDPAALPKAAPLIQAAAS
jgi:hypothetical protein